jgi:hypothetical protein
MPIRGGQSLIEHMRADQRMREIPVCVVSAEHADAPAGTVAVGKPFDLRELRDALRIALREEE